MTLTTEQCIEVAEIKLPGEYKTIVDKEDYEVLNNYKWKFSGDGMRRWASKNGKQFGILMHRVIMNCPDGKEIDHINRDPLDNRKINLRITNRQGNCWNTGPMLNKTSKYKGVHWNTKRKRWIAKIYKNKKSYQIGVYRDEIFAAGKYDERAKELFVEFAYLNFPEATHLAALEIISRA